MTKISEHITLAEATHNSAGLPNMPTVTQLTAMISVAKALFEPIRNWYGKPIKINSFFRSEAVNAKAGGVSTSQHCKGEAIDIDAGADNKIIFDWLIKSGLSWDQVIAEKPINGNPSWIHISYKLKGNRKEKLVFDGKKYVKL